MKVVLHVDEERVERLDIALTNIKNLLKEVDAESVSIALLANGPSVFNFMSSMPLERSEQISSFYGMGVRFYVCSNALEKFGISRDELHKKCTIAKAGIHMLVELQQKGYAYVKP